MDFLSEFFERHRDKMYFHSLNCQNFLKALSRKKSDTTSTDTKLARVLTAVDLTALGIGGTLGAGVYVLAGAVSKTETGPAIVVSFLIAAIASSMAALCYAEFGVRVPKAGSAYIYSYVCIGEFVAFMIGWNLILEYIIGVASVVKALFKYVDELSENTMSIFFEKNMSMDVPNLAPYPDLFSLGVPIIFSIALALGAKESSLVNNIFTMVNLCAVLFIIITGFWKVDTSLWTIPSDQIPPNFGTGGFAPYGINGIIKGAATCFYGFIGFDCIATASEEAKNPQKSIPKAIILSQLIVFAVYVGISATLTMMIPYYLQDSNAPFPHVYDQIGWSYAKYIVSVGAICALFASILGAMFPLPRIIYAMSSDGLLFRILGKIHPKFQTPFMGTLLAGAFTGTLSCIFELEQLYTMMSIGTLCAYSTVAACVLILRYAEEKKVEDEPKITANQMIRQMFNRKLKYPTGLSYRLVKWEVAIYYALCFCLGGILSQFETQLANGEAWVIILVTVFSSAMLVILISLAVQPFCPTKPPFLVPFVPWLPCLSILINTYLMTMLNAGTWMRFGIWILMGLITYFGYGLWNSNENHLKTGRNLEFDKSDNIGEIHL